MARLHRLLVVSLLTAATMILADTAPAADVTGRLFAPDGTTELASVQQTYSTITPGGIVLRSFSNIDGDTIELTDGSGTTLLEGFEGGGGGCPSWPFSPWSVVSGGVGTVTTAAAHDGSCGWVGSGAWVLNTSVTVGTPGDFLSMWVRVRPSGGGRLYLGFDATTGGAKSFVFAPNTNDIRFQDNPGYSFVELTSTPFTESPNTWYRMEIEFEGQPPPPGGGGGGPAVVPAGSTTTLLLLAALLGLGLLVCRPGRVAAAS